MTAHYIRRRLDSAVIRRHWFVAGDGPMQGVIATESVRGRIPIGRRIGARIVGSAGRRLMEDGWPAERLAKQEGEPEGGEPAAVVLALDCNSLVLAEVEGGTAIGSVQVVMVSLGQAEVYRAPPPTFLLRTTLR